MKRTYQPKTGREKRFTGLGRGWPQPAAEGFWLQGEEKAESRFQHRSSKTAFICFGKVLDVSKIAAYNTGARFQQYL